MSEIENWKVKGDSAVIIGRPIVTEQSIRLMDAEELIAWEMLYGTVVDCYKVATSQWRHFRCMMWHKQDDYQKILNTARAKMQEWIESEQFADYIHICGWEPSAALEGIRGVLDGKRNSEVKALLKQIAKQRDSRRNREDNFND